MLLFIIQGAGLILSLEASCARDSREKFRTLVFCPSLAYTVVLEWRIWNKWYVNCGYEIKWRMILAVMIVKIAIITARIILHLISYPQFTYDLFHIHHSREHMNPKLTCSNVSGFIAQLVEHRTSVVRSRVQAPLKSWIFFRLLFAIVKTARIILHLIIWRCNCAELLAESVYLESKTQGKCFRL